MSKITLQTPHELTKGLDNFLAEYGEGDIKTIKISFTNDMSHYGVIYQVITQLVKKGFACEKEIIDEWCCNLELIKDKKLWVKKC